MKHVEMDGITIVDYSPRYGPELVQMWRASFERGVGITDPHPLEDQLRALEEKIVPQNRVLLVLDTRTSAVVGFLAYTFETVSNLYVHIDHQNKGIGSMLLDIAKKNSGGVLRLFTFEANTRAQQFYERHGFKIIRRGFEAFWQLADIEYEWNRGG
jgi:ribosomal protein S18 acetylase RimI-like enzyme